MHQSIGLTDELTRVKVKVSVRLGIRVKGPVCLFPVRCVSFSLPARPFYKLFNKLELSWVENSPLVR